MTRPTLLLTGATGFLGGYVLRELLAATDAEVHCLVRPEGQRPGLDRLLERLATLSERYGPVTDARAGDIRKRVHAVPCSLESLGRGAAALPARIDAVWHVAALVSFKEQDRAAVFSANLDGTRTVIDAALTRGATAVHYVSTAYVAGERTGDIPEGPADERWPAHNPYEESKRASERWVVERCRTAGIGARIYRPSIVVGDSRDARAESEHGVYAFANAVTALREEVASRLPDFFRQHPLRVLGAPGQVLNFVAVDDVARRLVALGLREDTAGRWLHLTSPTDTTLGEILRIIGEASQVELVQVTDERDMSPMDALLRARTAIFQCYLRNPKRFSVGDALPSGERPAGVELGRAALQRLLDANAKSRTGMLMARRARMRKALVLLERREIPREPGGRLAAYFGAGGGRPLLLVNAYGQSLYFWNWFLLSLAGRRRVAIWQARGTQDDHALGRPFLLADQAGDLLAVLESLGPDPVDVVAWCTGPKVVLEAQARAPERFRTLTFVAGAFRPLGGQAGLETAYEASMEPLCRRIDAQPQLAGVVMDALKSILSGRAAGDGSLDLEIADVLALIPEELRGLVIGPFLSPGSILNYARQLLDFWAFDVSARLPEVRIPCLFVGSEHDRIASSAISRAAAQACPEGVYAELVGGTHFSMFERHEVLLELIEAFHADLAGVSFPDAQVRLEHRSTVTARETGRPPAVPAPGTHS